jgi:hypothetical protein
MPTVHWIKEENLSEAIDKVRQELDPYVWFLEGALNVEISPLIGFDLKVTLYFPSNTNETGWNEDSIEFATPAEAKTFLSRVHLIILTARAQQRGE